MNLRCKTCSHLMTGSVVATRCPNCDGKYFSVQLGDPVEELRKEALSFGYLLIKQTVMQELVDAVRNPFVDVEVTDEDHS